jgi:hypothetical protein
LIVVIEELSVNHTLNGHNKLHLLLDVKDEQKGGLDYDKKRERSNVFESCPRFLSCHAIVRGFAGSITVLGCSRCSFRLLKR